MNSRRHVQHLISDYIDGGLSTAAARRVEAHLADCPACAQELEQWRVMLRLVSTHATVPCPIDCASAVLWQIEVKRREAAQRSPALATRRTLRPKLYLPLLAVTLAFLGGGTWLWTLPIARQSTAGAWGRVARLWTAPPAHPPQLRSIRDMLAASHQPLDSNGLPLATAGSRPMATEAVRAYAPDRLEGALGRSDSLILAADFAEDDR